MYSDFRTEVLPGNDRIITVIVRNLRKGYGGPCYRSGDYRFGAGFWQLPECVYLPAASRLIGGPAKVGMSRL